MIFDSLKCAAQYAALSPRLKRAFDYLAATDLEQLEPGKHEIEGKEIFVNVQERELKRPEDAKLEVHDEYIDVQVVVKGTESFGWSPRADVKRPKEPFNTEKDIQFFEDTPQTYFTLVPGQFAVFFPEDAHAPLVGEGPIKKAIVKVRR